MRRLKLPVPKRHELKIQKKILRWIKQRKNDGNHVWINLFEESKVYRQKKIEREIEDYCLIVFDRYKIALHRTLHIKSSAIQSDPGTFILSCWLHIKLVEF